MLLTSGIAAAGFRPMAPDVSLLAHGRELSAAGLADQRMVN
jgi:hypothetical protein